MPQASSMNTCFFRHMQTFFMSFTRRQRHGAGLNAAVKCPWLVQMSGCAEEWQSKAEGDKLPQPLPFCVSECCGFEARTGSNWTSWRHGMNLM